MNDSTALVLIPLADATARAQAGIAEALTYVEIATDFKIESQADADIAAEQLVSLKKFLDAHDATRKELTDPYRLTGAAIKAEFDKATDKGGVAEKLLRSALTAWTVEQNRLAQIEKDRLEKIRKQEEEEAAKKLAGELARADTLKTPAAQARAAERIEEAAARVEEASVRTVAVAAPAKTKGFGLRDNWQPEYGNLQDLIVAAAANPKLAINLTWNTAQITATVKALKSNTDIPGVTAKNNQTSAVR